MDFTFSSSSGKAKEPACPRCGELAEENARLKNELLQTQTQLQVAGHLNEQLRQRLDETTQELAWSEEKLAHLQRLLYGKSSERVVGEDASQDESGQDDAASGAHDNPPDAADGTEDRSDDGSAKKPNRRKRRRTEHGWSKLPEHLERRPETHDVPEDQRVCPQCGGVMVRIGEDETERVEIEPPQLYVPQVVRPKYVCPHCKASGVKQAPAPPSPKPSSRFGFQFVTHVTVSKFSDHLPIYRQQDILARLGLEVSRSTLDGVLTTAAELLTPLAERMRERVLAMDLIGVDETPMKLIRKKNCEDEEAAIEAAAKAGCQTARMWAYHGFDEAPYDVFAFCLNREQKGPATFLQSFQGYVKADAFGTDDGVYLGASDRLVASGCWAHVRRKFFDAHSGGPRLAGVALESIRQLYDIEDAAKRLSPEVRHRVRAEHAAPVLKRLHNWAKREHARQLPKRSITLALGYLLNQWTALMTYLRDGRIPIDNTATERTIRPLTIGRNNWLFFASERGGHRAATIITVLHSAHRHCLDEMAYLLAALRILAAGPATSEALDSLLPDVWAKSHPEHVRTYRLREREQQQAAQRARREERRGWRLTEAGLYVPA